MDWKWKQYCISISETRDNIYLIIGEGPVVTHMKNFLKKLLGKKIGIFLPYTTHDGPQKMYAQSVQSFGRFKKLDNFENCPLIIITGLIIIIK